MSNLLNEDIDRLLDELELKRELTFVDKSPLGRGGFGTVYRARCANCPGTDYSFTRSSLIP